MQHIPHGRPQGPSTPAARGGLGPRGRGGSNRGMGSARNRPNLPQSSVVGTGRQGQGDRQESATHPQDGHSELQAAGENAVNALQDDRQGSATHPSDDRRAAQAAGEKAFNAMQDDRQESANHLHQREALQLGFDANPVELGQGDRQEAANHSQHQDRAAQQQGRDGNAHSSDRQATASHSSRNPQLSTSPAAAQDRMAVDFGPETQSGEMSERFDDEVQMYRPVAGQLRYLYASALRQGSVAVAALAHLHASAMGSTVMFGMTELEFRTRARNILWSMPLKVLECIVDGNLAASARWDEDLGMLFHDESDWTLESSIDAPVIYALILANRDGESPTASQLRQVISLLREYTSDLPQHAGNVSAVDNALSVGRSSRWQAEEGYQSFLHKKRDGRRYRVKGRRGVVEQFCNALEKRLDALARAGQSENTSLERPLMYIGYAHQFARRVAEHNHGESSFLLQLVRSVCRVLFEVDFEMLPYPICFLAEEREVRLAEVLMTQLVDSFSWTGGGFNIHPAGINSSSADLRGWTTENVFRIWTERRNFRDEQGFWDDARLAEQSDLEERSEATETPRHDLKGYHGRQRDTLQSLRQERQAEERTLQELSTNILQTAKDQMREAARMLADADQTSLPSNIIEDLRRPVEGVMDQVLDTETTAQEQVERDESESTE